jgi:DNA-binding beta-propeller fold protein YncE
MIEHGDLVYSANQYTDAVDVFGITPDERIEQRPSIKGFSMPHGLDIRPDGLMAVTNYGDNTVRVVDLERLAA